MGESFEDLYDDETIAALDAWTPPRSGIASTPRRTGLAGHAGAGVVAASMMRGLAEVFEPENETSIEIIEVEPTVSGGPGERVTLFYVPNDPHATVAVVRGDR